MFEIQFHSFIESVRQAFTSGQPWGGRPPGEFAKLKSGRVHYQWHGPKDGPVLVLVHGLTTPSFVWGPLLPALTKAGLRVLTYDLYGRGYSDRPFARHTSDFFVKQLDQLLDHLRLGQKVNLLGYSMGGGIVSCFAASHRNKVNNLILLAPVGFHVNPDWFTRWANLPLIGDLMMQFKGGQELRREALRSMRREKAPRSIVKQQMRETRSIGYLRSVLSSIRQFPMGNLRPVHRHLAALHVPVHGIWGESDNVVPAIGAMDLSRINPDSRTIIIPGAGHCLAYTHPEEMALAAQHLLAQPFAKTG